MSDAQSNAAIVSFEHPSLGSAGTEFKGFDVDIAIAFLEHLDKILAGRIDHWTLAPFDEYLGIPIYKAEAKGQIMIYAVEEQNLGDRKITVMLCDRPAAGRRGDKSPPAAPDLATLRASTRSRAAIWFS